MSLQVFVPFLGEFLPVLRRMCEFGSTSARFSRHFLVHLEGLEPPTLGSEDRCSIQLSYRCI
jgi:hypothetical protein